METFAAIDIGSNAARLNISSVYIVNSKFIYIKLLYASLLDLVKQFMKKYHYS